MNRSKSKSQSPLDRAVEIVRNEPVDPVELDAAASRVWQRLQSEGADEHNETAPVATIGSCGDFQSLIPARLAGDLTEARTLLFDDHVNECIPCRKALKQMRSGPPARKTDPSAPAPAWGFSIPRRTIVRGAIAATLVASFSVLPFTRYFSPFSDSLLVTVEAAEGDVFRVLSTDISRIAPGDRIDRGQRVRTARNAGAVVNFGERGKIEMRERSEFAIAETATGITVRLDRGNVIVENPDASHRVVVTTADSEVVVSQGTASVSSATRGTRVSSLDGDVRFVQNGSTQALKAGDQAISSPTLTSIAVDQDIAWSRKHSQYVEALAEIAALRTEIDARAPRPGVRTSTRLLNKMPAGTVFYAALPNLTDTLVESQKILDERIAQSPALKDWWSENHSTGDAGQALGPVFDKIKQFGNLVGEEIAIGVQRGASGKREGIVVIADVPNSAALRAFVTTNIASAGQADNLVFVDDAATLPGLASGPDSVFVWFEGDVMIATADKARLQQIAEGKTFAGSAFHSRIESAYAQGVGILVAADLESIVKNPASRNRRSQNAMDKLGVSDLRHFVVDEKGITGQGGARAILSYGEQRRGITSWLAAPGPNGALEYVSPNASVMAAFVVQEPAALVGDLLGFIRDMDPQAGMYLDKFQAENGIDLRRDFAEPLGGEYAFAIDGPVLPTPAWKMVFEVYDSGHMLSSIKRTVEQLNVMAARENKPGFELASTTQDGHDFYVLKSAKTGTELHFVFADGYLIVAGSRVLLTRALEYRETGYSVLRSEKFKSVLPSDGQANFSALFYHDLGQIVGQVADVMPSGAQTEQLRSIAGGNGPTLVYAYAFADRLEIAANTDKGALGLSPSSLVGLPNGIGLQSILMEGLSGR